MKSRKKIDASFQFMDKSKAESVLPELYNILYTNMSIIAPTGNSYEEDKKEWLSCVAPALERIQRQIILIVDRDTLAGYFQYYVNNGVFMMEEIQFKPEYHGSGLFEQLYRYLIAIIPSDTEAVEAYADKRNEKSQAILKHLGLEMIGENKNGNCWRFRGKYNTLVGKFHNIEPLC